MPELQEGDCLGIRVGLGWPGGQGPRVGGDAGVGASGGVFITTSGFSSDALKYVERLNPRVILIDAKQLGRLMVEYGVGVTTTQTLRVTEVDENFFDGD